MNVFSIWQQALYSAWTDLFTRLLLFLPVLLGSILVFAVGLMIADWLSQLLSHFLKVVKFQRLTSEAGLDKFLKKADIGYDASQLLVTGLKWLIVLVFFMASANILGLTTISTVLNSLISYVPRVLTAILVVALGAFFARLVEGLVRGALASVDHAHARPLSQVARWTIMVIAVLAGFKELRIAETLVDTFFQGLTWTITLAIGLGVGLGSKDLVASVLRDWYDKLNK